MSSINRPHLLGVDDGPFDKRHDESAPLVGVLTEGHDLVEGVAVTRFPVDGAGSAEFLARWIAGLRFGSGLHGIVLGGITIAGLGIVEIQVLSDELGVPVLIVNRQAPTDEPLTRALQAAGLGERIPIVERSPATWRFDDGLYVAHAGTSREEAARLLEASRGKSQLPEALRLAHLIGAAVATGESRGRP
jgi:endonuclease V-like protein UPF0215 family